MLSVQPDPTAGQILGTVWQDLNGNGAQDDGESGLEDWTVFIDLNRDGAAGAGEAETIH